MAASESLPIRASAPPLPYPTPSLNRLRLGWKSKLIPPRKSDLREWSEAVEPRPHRRFTSVPGPTTRLIMAKSVCRKSPPPQPPTPTTRLRDVVSGPCATIVSHSHYGGSVLGCAVASSQGPPRESESGR